MPGATGPAGPDFVMAASASVGPPTTPVPAEAVLFPGIGSGVEEETAAVFVTSVPEGAVT